MGWCEVVRTKGSRIVGLFGGRPASLTIICLAGLAFFWLCLWLLYPQQMFHSDPWFYSRDAFRIANDFRFGDGMQAQRIGVTVPVAVIYKFFGVSILTTNAWPFIAVLMIAAVVWFAVPDRPTRVIALVLCATSVPLLTASVILLPDAIATAFMAASSLVLFRRREVMARLSHPGSVGAVAVSMLFMAFLSKESVYWVVPLWIVAGVADRREPDWLRMRRQFYLPAAVLGLALGIAYLLFCWWAWGDPLSRIHVVQSLTGVHSWAMGKAAAGTLQWRLTRGPVDFLRVEYGLPLLLVVAFGLVRPPKWSRQWILYGALCLGFFWFGSTSLSSYQPLPLNSRMLFPMVPALYIIGAEGISRHIMRPLAPASAGRTLRAIMVLALLSLPFVTFVKENRTREAAEQSAMDLLKARVEASPNNDFVLITSDKRSPQFLKFYFGYRPPGNLKLVYAGDATDQTMVGREGYAYMNRDYSQRLKLRLGYPHYDEEIESAGLVAVYRTPTVGLFELPPSVRIVRADDLREPSKRPHQ